MILRLKANPLIKLAPKKYLGVILSNSGLRFSRHFDYVNEKASRAIISANMYIRQAVKGHLPINHYLKVFDTQIRPIIEYASEIWCPGTPVKDLERVHLKFLKSILGVSQSTPTAAILGETGRFPLHMRQQDNLLYKIHNELLQLARQGHDTWAGRVENVIRKYTTDLPSHNAMPLDNKAIDALGNKLRELRYNQFICNWKMDLHQQDELPKLDTYKIIKSDNRIKPYILFVRNKRYQRALTQLWVSSHKLNIEISRHSRPYIPRHQKFCLYCDTGEIDDEIHFLLNALFIRLVNFPCSKKLSIISRSNPNRIIGTCLWRKFCHYLVWKQLHVRKPR